MQPTNYVTVPEGRYTVRVAEVRPGFTRRNAHPMWSLRLVVVGGEHDGLQAAWDALLFAPTPHDRARTRHILDVFGCFADELTGFDAVHPHELEGQTCEVCVRPATYHTPHGEAIVRNEVVDGSYRTVL